MTPLLRDSCNYHLLMASSGKTNIKIEIVLKHENNEMLLGKDSFFINSKTYQGYEGYFSDIDFDLSEDDEIVLRVIASGDDFGMVLGGQTLPSSLAFLKLQQPIDHSVIDERNKALLWMAVNTKGELSSDLFRNFRYQLHRAIADKYNCNWNLGWGLTETDKPYCLEWLNNRFRSKKLTIEEAKSQEIEKKMLQYRVILPEKM